LAKENKQEEEVMGVKHKPGEIPSNPGEYRERGPRCGKVPNAKQVTIEPGDKPMPPTTKKGNIWERIGPPNKK
jgi:YjzC-like protein